jgi:ubiquinone/menaquinone biosynthesis C-methylase UbiE
MSSIRSIKKIKEFFNSGQNIMEFLRSKEGKGNDWETIMISYDLQAGSYIEFASKNEEYIKLYTDSIAKVITDLGKFESIMEIGVGEATIMTPLMKKIDIDSRLRKFAFDISWSRTRYAKDYSYELGVQSNFFIANLFSIPLADNSIDIVYTSHSLEPNGGKEKEALAELYRVASKYVVLLEPDYRNADEKGKERMNKNGYVKDLDRHAEELGFTVIEHRPFNVFVNPLNPTGLTILQKKGNTFINEPNFICPISHTKLERFENVLFSEESGLMYPIINELPCLLETNAFLGTHFKKFNN